jgi:multidrug resistance efflux pump
VPAAAPPPPRKKSNLPLYLGLLALGGGILVFMNWQAREREARTNVQAAVEARTAKVSVGAVEQRVRVSGVTSATNYALIEVPRLRGADRGMNILKMAPSGSFVKKGDVVLEFDAQSIKDRIDDDVATLRERENDIKKLKVQQALDMENLQQTLRVARSELDKARLDSKASEIRTEVDRELLKLAVEEYDARYKELAADLKQKEASQKAEMRISQINLEMQKIRVDRSTKDLEKLVVVAPMNGMIVLETVNRPGGDTLQIQVGDSVNPGQRVLRIVDPSSMQITGTINQAECSLLRIGQAASIGLDAYPAADYRGKVYSIGALATRGFRDQYYIRSIPISVGVANPDLKMIPDLSASADVLLGKAENVVVAPASAIEREGENAFVYVKGGKGFERRLISMGLNNGSEVAITEGLKPGEEVRIN